MKTNTIKTTQNISLVMLVAAMAFPGCSTVGDNPHVTTAAAAIQKQADYKAQLRAEANAPGLSRQARATIGRIVAAKQAREMEEIAQFEQFKMDQRIRLAEASAPRTIVMNSPGNPSRGVMPASYRNNAGRENALVAEWLRAAAANPQAAGLPDPAGDTSLDAKTVRFYRRQALEAAADAIVKDSSERAASVEGGAEPDGETIRQSYQATTSQQ